MNTSTALAFVEQEFDSLEDFIWRLLYDDEGKKALDESLPLTLRAKAAGVPLPVFSRILNHPQFRVVLRGEMTNTIFNLETERKHVKKVAAVAAGEKRLVMSSRGDMGYVDQAASDLIAAGKYLNDLRGSPVQGASGTQGAGITINIHNANDEAREVVDVAFSLGSTAEVHQPKRAGDLPPPGVLGRGSPATHRESPEADSRSSAKFPSLYGEAAAIEEENRRKEEKVAARPAGQRPQLRGDSSISGRPWGGD